MSLPRTSTSDTELFPQDRKFVSSETYDAFFAVVERLEAAITAETSALSTCRHHDIVGFTQQKRQGFLELARIMRSMENAIPSPDILARLAHFRSRLEANEAMLRVYLRAVQDVTAIIVRVIRESESDGTYSLAYGRADHTYA